MIKRKAAVFFLIIIVFLVFESLGVSARAADTALLPRTPAYWARGGIGVALADDPATVFYNPAGLAETGIGFTWQNGDLNGLTCNNDELKVLTLGPLAYANWFYQTRDGLRQGTDAYAFGYRGTDSIDWGVTFKKVWQAPTATTTGQDGWAADLGIRARLTTQLILGVSAYNLVKQGPLGDQAGRIGLAWRDDKNNYALGWDGQWQSNGNKISNYVGGELLVAEGLIGRVGWADGTWTLGGGLRLPLIDIDYAFNKSDQGSSHLVSVGVEFWSGRPKIKSGLFLRPAQAAVIRFEGAVEGGESQASILGGLRLGSDDLLVQIERAATNPAIDGVILYLKPFSSGFGQEALVQEWRQQLLKLKEKNKVIVAYLEGPVSSDEYYLAALADRIVMPELSWIGGFDKNIYLMKLGKLSKNWGLNWQIIKRGKYKTDTNEFSPLMTEEEKKVLADLLDQQKSIVLADVARDRKIDPVKLNLLSNKGLITAFEARDNKLIDEIGYMPQAEDAFKKLLNRGGDVVKVDDLPPVEDGLAYLWPFGDKVALINVQGEITRGQSASNIIFGGQSTGAEDLAQQIDLACDDKRVKAIILRINSPGGDEMASDQIYRKLQAARHDDGKIIVASVGDMAASGGYYLAAGCDLIMADPSSLIGSIGNFSIIPDLSGLYEKLGIEIQEIGHGQVYFPTSRPLNDKEKQLMEAYIEAGYQMFIQAVAKGRGLAEEKVRLLADGRLFTGLRSKQIGLIDKTGNFYAALDEAKRLAGISGRPQIISYQSIEGHYWPMNLLVEQGTKVFR